MNKETTSASQLSLSALFAKQCRLKAHRTAVVSAGREICYAQLDERSRRLQSLLSSLGCAPGDRVCILSENSPLFLELAIAAIRLKLIVSTLNFRLSAKEIRHCVELVQPKVTIVSPRLASLLADTTGGEILETGEAFHRSNSAM